MSIVKDTIAITAITLVAGLALGVVQDITADPIAQQQEQSKQEAYKAVFEDADSFEVYDVDADALAANLAENNFNAQTINEIMKPRMLPVRRSAMHSTLQILKDMAETSSSPWEFRMTEP